MLLTRIVYQKQFFSQVQSNRLIIVVMNVVECIYVLVFVIVCVVENWLIKFSFTINLIIFVSFVIDNINDNVVKSIVFVIVCEIIDTIVVVENIISSKENSKCKLMFLVIFIAWLHVKEKHNDVIFDIVVTTMSNVEIERHETIIAQSFVNVRSFWIESKNIKLFVTFKLIWCDEHALSRDDI